MLLILTYCLFYGHNLLYVSDKSNDKEYTLKRLPTLKLISCLLTAIIASGAFIPSFALTAQKNSTPKEDHGMKFNNFAYIFLGPGLDPTSNRTEIKTQNFQFTAVGIDFNHKDQVIKVAKELVAQGAQMIELCGGFGPLWIAKVSEAIDNKVPVGSVAYGPEARKPLLDLLSNEKNKS